uniref:Cytochrome b6-f complex subunit 6 n=1 Tax=Cyanophora paradoxa TaxID=2762 RepID=PETL_CYAPA|nr:hypothetical protein CypaCp100 [Cyanophora paradoxa]P48102.1 RecName: Full=Cytochrome b6-f complex subunit 6; AltName: Full=Cytochrome b6-f complex subunit PetL; AltName: Full=Cytochrome b6-f complex subunit VI [Cyanophora paradoxa]AAA81268.1 ycf7 [Cyanophora paradoxa]
MVEYLVILSGMFGLALACFFGLRSIKLI